MIRLFRYGLDLMWDFSQNTKLKNLILARKDLLIKYKTNPRAYVLLYNATRVEWIKNPSFMDVFQNLFQVNS